MLNIFVGNDWQQEILFTGKLELIKGIHAIFLKNIYKNLMKSNANKISVNLFFYLFGCLH